MIPVITIDGPGGSGKGTIASLLAKQLGWHCLDSGALYRITGVTASKRGIATDDAEGLVALIESIEIRFVDGQTLVDGVDIEGEIRTETAGELASQVASVPAVRDALFELQRNFAKAPGLIADGRDMGTVIFPDAPLKIFLTATAEARAQRRYKQLREKGFDVTLGSLLDEIVARDKRDTERTVAPLKPAESAVILDSTQLTIDEVLRAAMDLAKARNLI